MAEPLPLGQMDQKALSGDDPLGRTGRFLPAERFRPERVRGGNSRQQRNAKVVCSMPDPYAPARHTMAYQEIWGPNQSEEARATVHL